MTDQYNRQIKLELFANNTQFTITELHVDFEINMSIYWTPNQAKITVYNLALETRALLNEAHQGVRFYAGYGDNVKLIFSGQTTNVVSSGDIPTNVTTIYAGEGQKSYDTRFFNRSYKKGTLVTRIFKDVANEFGLDQALDLAGIGAKLLTGLTLSGRTKDVLNRLADDYGLVWSINNDTLEIMNEFNSFRPDPTAVVLRPDTGMIGSPKITNRTEPPPPEDAKKKKKKKKKDEEDELKLAIKVTALLNPDIRAGRLIKIESANTTLAISDLFKKAVATPVLDAQSLYICQRIRYYGNNYGGPFYVDIEADLDDE